MSLDVFINISNVGEHISTSYTSLAKVWQALRVLHKKNVKAHVYMSKF